MPAKVILPFHNFAILSLNLTFLTVKLTLLARLFVQIHQIHCQMDVAFMFLISIVLIQLVLILDTSQKQWKSMEQVPFA
jgi:hypothetical protein